MLITAVTKFKLAELYAILKRLGLSQSELARRVKIKPSNISDIICLKKRPSKRTANAIQAVLGEAGEFIDVLSIWPETFKGLHHGFKHESTANIEPEMLPMCHEALQIPNQSDELDFDKEALDESLSKLNPIEFSILDMRSDGMTLEQIGEKINLTREQIRRIQNTSIGIVANHYAKLTQ